jgi:hypothetical protein
MSLCINACALRSHRLQLNPAASCKRDGQCRRLTQAITLVADYTRKKKHNWVSLDNTLNTYTECPD